MFCREWSVSQLNIQMNPEFERNLAQLMRLRGLKTKSETIRVAVQESLERLLDQQRKTDFHEWLGLAVSAPQNPSPRFGSDDDLWA